MVVGLAACSAWSPGDAGVAASGAASAPAPPPASTLAPPPASAAAAEDLLAAESLKHSAISLVYAPPGTPARAGRLVAAARFAESLNPGDPRIALLLADICESQGRLPEAADAARRALAANPQDYALGLRWLRLKLATLQTAEQRVKFLDSVAGDAGLPGELEAEAAAQAGEILRRQGRSADAIDQFELALRLDPYNPAAVQGRLALRSDPTTVDRAASMLRLLRGNPFAVSIAWELAVLLGTLGLHEQALEFFDYAWTLSQRPSADQAGLPLLATQYFNAMLDAGRFEPAVKKFSPMPGRFGQGADMSSLLIEAYRRLGEQQEADRIVQAMQGAYEARKSEAAASASLAGELAWFNLLTLGRPAEALAYARQAAAIRSDDSVTQRILGFSELSSGDPKLVAEGKARLDRIVTKDVYAAAFLAEHAFSRGDAAAGQKAILSGAALTRSGPAFRRLLAVARKQNVTIPPARGSVEARELVKAFDRRCLEMALAPERFIAVEIRPLSERVRVGEALEIEAVLANRSAVDVSVGDWGLLSPVLSLKASVQGRPAETFANLPLAVWAAPRYLRPAKTLRCVTRIDVAELALFLASNPLEELSLVVTPSLDPVARGTTFESALPSVAVKGVTITRMSLLGPLDNAQGDAWSRAYRSALVEIVRDIKKGQLPARMRSARQVGALLRLVDNVAKSRARLPKPLAGVVTKPMLLSMMRAELQDASCAVRSEMIAALDGVDLDRIMLKLLGPAVEDQSSLVRFRVVESYGVARLPALETSVDYLARDKDERVRMMAQAFGRR